jgi:pyridoxal phosphate enzyme (YggS family)
MRNYEMNRTDDTVAALVEVNDRIAAAAREDGRRPEAVSLIAVTKTYDAESIRPALDKGHRRFGENRVQEAAGKWPQLRQEYTGIELHLIGPLQSNKARQAVELFDVIHTVDRPKIAEAIALEIGRQDRAVELFIQVNTGEEPQKAGITPRETGNFVRFCRDELQLPVRGLMCIPPVDEEPAVHFALLAKLAAENGLSELSMGMSSDYEIAIKFGATHVRVGSAIFGARA